MHIDGFAVGILLILCISASATSMEHHNKAMRAQDPHVFGSSNKSSWGQTVTSPLGLGQAYPRVIGDTTNNTCKPLNWEIGNAFAIVSSDIMSSGLSLDHASKTVVPLRCWSTITLTKSTNKETVSRSWGTINLTEWVTAQIVEICSDCANESIFLSPQAYAELGEPRPSQNSSIRVAWFVDHVLVTRDEEDKNEWNAYAYENITEDVLYKEIRAAFAESVRKNSLILYDRCDLVSEAQRVGIIQSGNYTQRTNVHELHFMLNRINQIPGALCNSYQNLNCAPTKRGPVCQCALPDYGIDTEHLYTACLHNVFDKQQSCIANSQSATEQQYGVSLPHPTNLCFGLYFCKLTAKGAANCSSEHEQRRRERQQADLDPDGRSTAGYMFRFPMALAENGNTSTATAASPDCVCMPHEKLFSLSSESWSIFYDLAVFSSKSYLEFEDHCDPRAEDVKKSYFYKLRSMDTPLNIALFQHGVFDNLETELNMRSRTAEALNVLARINGTFCKTYQRLRCNSKSQRCECASVPEDNVEFVWTFDFDREGEDGSGISNGSGTCLLRRDSVCDPAYWSGRFENYVNPYEEDVERPACELGLSCIDVATGGLCPRNSTGLSFKDKVFPYLLPVTNPYLALEEAFARVGAESYCRCGEERISTPASAPLSDRSLNLTLLIPAALGLSAIMVLLTSLVWYNRRLRASKQNFLLKLSEMERRRFLDGNPQSGNESETGNEAGDEDSAAEDGGIQAQCLPYDRQRYEIPKKCLTYGQQLGAGGFGLVVKGTLKRNSGLQTEVAVKMCHDTNTDNLRSFLIELKILMYIGLHENVIQLMGAVTENVGSPQLVLEYCERGSLDRILEACRDSNQFLNQIVGYEVDTDLRGSSVQVHPYDRLWTICTKNLIRWSAQVANGMNYLSGTKRVIHGDLFLKNVLISGNGVAKVTDFGLSRRFAYDGKSYIRINEGFFPCAKLLPPEARQEPRKLSPALDSWSFGVLLWEMFTLGREPDCVQCATELAKPEFATTGLYSLMRSCWAADPIERSNFKQLKEEFRVMLGLGPGPQDADGDRDSDEGINESFHFGVNFVPATTT